MTKALITTVLAALEAMTTFRNVELHRPRHGEPYLMDQDEYPRIFPVTPEVVQQLCDHGLVSGVPFWGGIDSTRMHITHKGWVELVALHECARCMAL